MSITLKQPPARCQVATRIKELAVALDGFPMQALEALVINCLEPNDAERAAQARMALLVDRVLDQWIAKLGHDIAQMPPSTMDVLRAISQRTHATRDALVEVRSLLNSIARADGVAAPARAGLGPAAAARPSA